MPSIMKKFVLALASVVALATPEARAASLEDIGSAHMHPFRKIPSYVGWRLGECGRPGGGLCILVCLREGEDYLAATRLWREPFQVDGAYFWFEDLSSGGSEGAFTVHN